MTRDDTLRKIKALLAKEGAGGTTPQEVAASLALAARMMEREGISRCELEVSGSTEAEPEEDVKIFESPLSEGKRSSTWKIRLAQELCSANGCFIYSSGGNIMIVGRPSDAEVTRYLFAYCAGEIERLAVRACRGEGKTFANNFRIGCTDAIGKALQSERDAERASRRAAVASDSRALLVLDTAIQRMDNREREAMRWAESKLRLRSGTRGGSRGDAAGRAAGQRAGAGIYPGSRKGISGGGQLRIGSGD